MAGHGEGDEVYLVRFDYLRAGAWDTKVEVQEDLFFDRRVPYNTSEHLPARSSRHQSQYGHGAGASDSVYHSPSGTRCGR